MIKTLKAIRCIFGRHDFYYAGVSFRSGRELYQCSRCPKLQLRESGNVTRIA